MASNHFEPIPVTFASPTTKHQQTPSSEPSSSPSGKTQLRVQFQPCDYSVVCGRGKDSFNHVGNRRFRILASMFIETYSEADSKAAKSAVVSRILEVIRQAGGHFCKYESGAWFDVGGHCAREKVSALLRDLLHTQYRSSAKSKLDRHQKKVRKQKQEQNQNLQSSHKEVDGIEDSNNSSMTASCFGRNMQNPNQSSSQTLVEIKGIEESDDSSTTSSCWGTSKDSLGFEYWLEESDDFFAMDVF
jgi:hypothetical protein